MTEARVNRLYVFLTIAGMLVTLGVYLGQVRQNTADVQNLKETVSKTMPLADAARKDIEDERWSEVQQSLTDIKTDLKDLRGEVEAKR